MQVSPVNVYTRLARVIPAGCGYNEDLDFLAQSAAADACAPGNPKPATVEDFKALFRKIM